MTAVSTTRAKRTLVQTLATVVAIVFLLVGIAGFIPGVTTSYGSMGFAGMSSMAMLLGIFQVSVLHNVVHLLFGIVGLVLARTSRGARNYLIVGGIIYFVLWLYGIFTGMSAANFVPLNSADNWLHLGLAIGMVALGLIAGRTTGTRQRSEVGTA